MAAGWRFAVVRDPLRPLVSMGRSVPDPRRGGRGWAFGRGSHRTSLPGADHGQSGLDGRDNGGPRRAAAGYKHGVPSARRCQRDRAIRCPTTGSLQRSHASGLVDDGGAGLGDSSPPLSVLAPLLGEGAGTAQVNSWRPCQGSTRGPLLVSFANALPLPPRQLRLQRWLAAGSPVALAWLAEPRFPGGPMFPSGRLRALEQLRAGPARCQYTSPLVGGASARS